MGEARSARVGLSAHRRGVWTVGDFSRVFVSFWSQQCGYAVLEFA